jgi:AcrR family transcriptional regulator
VGRFFERSACEKTAVNIRCGTLFAVSVQERRRRYSPRLPREERREQILDAALRLLAGYGFNALTMDGIAAEAAIAKSVLYAIFESQAGLQSALLRREQERAFALAGASLDVMAQADDPLDGAIRALEHYLDGVARHPDTYRLAFLPVGEMPPSVRDAISKGRERWRRALEPLVARALGASGLGGVDPQLASHLVRGNVEYVARLLLERPDEFPRERIVAFATQLFTTLAQSKESL